MTRLFPAVSLLMGVVLVAGGALAQPAPGAASSTPSFSVAELERFIEGRTLLTVDLKDAKLEEVAAALGKSLGQTLGVRPPFVAPVREGVVVPPPPAYSLSATQMPFWEALRGWQVAARRASEAAALAEGGLGMRRSRGNVLNSVGLQKDNEGLWLQADNRLADGRAVAAWPFLVVGTDLRRSQEAGLSEEGLTEIELRPMMMPRPRFAPGAAGALQPGAPKTNEPKAPVPEEDRWLDRLVLSTQVYIDPKIDPVGLQCEVVEAVDDKGNDLRLREDEAPGRGGTSYGSVGLSRIVPINMRSKPGMGKRLVRLRGVLRFNIVTRSQHWETTDLNTPVEDTLQRNGGDFKVKFGGIEQKGNQWVAKFSAQSEGNHLRQFWEQEYNSRFRHGPFALSRGMLNFEGVPALRLVDENGREFTASGGGRHSASLRGKNPTAVPAPNISPDVSPVPADVAQNYIYTEDKEFSLGPVRTFSAANGGTAGGNMAGGSSAVIGRPVKFVVDFPIERREVSVPFEFTNLPLPPS